MATTQFVGRRMSAPLKGGLGAVSFTKSPFMPPEIVIGVYVVTPPVTAGFGDWVGTETANTWTLSVGVAVAVVTAVVLHWLVGHSVAVIVKDPLTEPAVTDVFVKLVPTATQLLVGALKVAPVGIVPAVNLTKSPLNPLEIVIM